MYAATSGYRNDGDAGLTHVGARYYDAQVGRFISRDTYLDQKPYLYCEHDPINNLDPTGHETVIIVPGKGTIIRHDDGTITIIPPAPSPSPGGGGQSSGNGSGGSNGSGNPPGNFPGNPTNPVKLPGLPVDISRGKDGKQNGGRLTIHFGSGNSVIFQGNTNSGVGVSGTIRF